MQVICLLVTTCVATHCKLPPIPAQPVQGTFNAVSAGMLLYIGLVQLVAEDFSRREEAAHGGGAGHTHGGAHSEGGQAVVAAGGFGGKGSGGVDDVAEAKAAAAVEAHRATDFAHGHALAATPRWLVPASHGALFLGAAFMALLGLWA
jgi:hypothetical protein